MLDKFLLKMIHVRHVAKGNLLVYVRCKKQRPELFVSNVRKVDQSIVIKQIGKFEFDGELVTKGSCCISKVEGGSRVGIYSGFLLTVMDCELILGSPSLEFQNFSKSPR